MNCMDGGVSLLLQFKFKIAPKEYLNLNEKKIMQEKQPEQEIIKLSEFTYESVKFKELEAVTFTDDQIHLLKDAHIEVLYGPGSERINKIFSIQKDRFNVFKLSQDKRSLEYVSTDYSDPEQPQKLKYWSEIQNFHLLRQSGDLIKVK